MDAIAVLLKLAHVVLAMLLVGGLVGRWIVLHRAEESRELPQTLSLVEAPFERMTIVSLMLILPAGLATAWAQGYAWLGLTTGWMLASVVIYLGVLALVPAVFLPRGRRFAAVLAGAREAGPLLQTCPQPLWIRPSVPRTGWRWWESASSSRSWCSSPSEARASVIRIRLPMAEPHRLTIGGHPGAPSVRPTSRIGRERRHPVGWRPSR
jgi:uncharacterized membrane protein